MNIKELSASSIIKNAYSVSKELGIPIFLVGGIIRDFLLSSKLGKDFDFAVDGSAREVAGLYAYKTGGSFFCLDSQREHYRVTIRRETEITDIDFSRLQGDTITKDLEKRDFTINSMAIPLRDLFGKDDVMVIDPFHGITDLEKGMIRVCSSVAFDDDPLRLLRAARISSVRHLRIENETERLISEKKRLLTNTSWERIRDELFQILNVQNTWRSIEKLQDLGLLDMVFPEVHSRKDIDQGKHHDYNLFGHAIKTVESIESILINISQYFPAQSFPDYYSIRIREHFDEVLEKNVTRYGLIKLIAFLHDSGKGKTKRCRGKKAKFLRHEKVGGEINEIIAKRLKLSRNSIRIVTLVTENHMRILNLTIADKITKKTQYRFFRDLGKDSIDCLLLSLADGLAKKISGPFLQKTHLLDIAQDFLRYYFEDWPRIPLKPLMNGNEIMEFLGIPQGREVGIILSALREAEGQGYISTKDEAKALAKSTHSKIHKRMTLS